MSSENGKTLWNRSTGAKPIGSGEPDRKVRKVTSAGLPELTSKRLRLRAFTMDDCEQVQNLAGNFNVSTMLLSVPYPYEDGMAEEWISTHEQAWLDRSAISYAITGKLDDELIGCVSLGMKPANHSAELGYWIGEPHWNKGYCSEACRVLVEFARGALSVNRFYAVHLTRNPASGRVMQKIGMTLEGRLRQHACKEGKFEDVMLYGLLAEELE